MQITIIGNSYMRGAGFYVRRSTAAEMAAFKRLKFWPIISADDTDQENCISSTLTAASQTKIIAK